LSDFTLGPDYSRYLPSWACFCHEEFMRNPEYFCTYLAISWQLRIGRLYEINPDISINLSGLYIVFLS
jgi:hypothetical protein